MYREGEMQLIRSLYRLIPMSCFRTFGTGSCVYIFQSIVNTRNNVIRQRGFKDFQLCVILSYYTSGTADLSEYSCLAFLQISVFLSTDFLFVYSPFCLRGYEHEALTET